ncbi:integration host factor subunit alpha [Stigmatella sp. ncwal1]|uniref:Integration host factor subunit alpha n=1 Tax=Stigmatella ashevillensis TaxID=2995309 RepID=A0ABT5D1F7_9BACT|nr:integration host factor subunit alpha [Stigmatella ashevillena]MDC0706910.1 integration host factor subunit alpha [Stigmatella ashevillena]
MTKADIIEGVYEKVGFSKKESAEIVELVFDTLKETLERGDKIKISGFGNFQVRQKKARVGRNPQTGKEIEISARRVLTFRPSQVLKSALNGEAPPENHAEIDARDEENDENEDFDSEDMDSEDMEAEGAEGGKY